MNVKLENKALRGIGEGSSFVGSVVLYFIKIVHKGKQK